MKKTSLQKLLLLCLMVLSAFTAGPSSSLAVTDEEIASIGLDVDADTTLTTQVDSTTPPTLTGILGRLGLALGLVFALMGAVLWIARRFFPQSLKNVTRGASIDILASRSLGQRRQLLMVRARGKTVLLGVTPHSIQCLTEIDEEALAWDAAASGAGLASTKPFGQPASFELPDTTDMGDL